MLTDIEKQGVLDIVSALDQEEIFALSDTVTNRMITTNSKREALEAIVAYSESPEAILRRRKVRRDVLFQYLASQNANILPTMEKKTLIRITLQLWGSRPEDNGEDKNDDPTGNDGEDKNDDPAGNDEDVLDLEPFNGLPMSHNPQEGQIIAERFARWFFNMLNATNPRSGLQSEDQFTPIHFYSDCKLSVKIQSSDSCEEEQEQEQEEHIGSGLVHRRLVGLVQQQNFLLNPSSSANGIRGRSEPHGLVVVFVCGTVHHPGQCVGVFEQCFGLARDPTSLNNYKVKYSDLKLKIGSTTRAIKNH